jgi:hypothetical protein
MASGAAHLNFPPKGICVITHHVEAAAFAWAFRAKRAHNDVAAGLNGLAHGVYIGLPHLWCGQKMENRAIVPNGD